MNLKSKSSDPESAVSVLPLAQTVALEGGPRRERWDRLRYVLGHPIHLVLLTVLLLTGVFAATPWVLLPLVVLELIGAVALPRVRWIKQRADRRRRERRRLTAARARAHLVAFMEAVHGRELTELERRAAAARAHAASFGDSMEALLDDWYGLDRLLGTYVRLSIAHRTARESAAMTDPEALCHQIRQLEAARDSASSPRLRRLVDRQLTLLRSRAACLEHNDEEREALALELGSVAALCRLVHERTFTLVSSADLHSEVERVVAEIQLHDQVLGEITRDDDADDELDESTEMMCVSHRNTGVRVAPVEQEDDSDASEPNKALLRASGMG